MMIPGDLDTPPVFLYQFSLNRKSYQRHVITKSAISGQVIVSRRHLHMCRNPALGRSLHVRTIGTNLHVRTVYARANLYPMLDTDTYGAVQRCFKTICTSVQSHQSLIFPHPWQPIEHISKTLIMPHPMLFTRSIFLRHLKRSRTLGQNHFLTGRLRYHV